jgi:hypothetical protein
MPDCFQDMGTQMRKMLSIGIAAMLIAVAITAWAMAVARPQKDAETATRGIDVFTMMTGAKDLQAQRYEAF